MQEFGEFSVGVDQIHASPPVRAKSIQRINSKRFEHFEEFKAKLLEAGVQLSRSSTGSKRRSFMSQANTIENLFLEEQANECQISIVEGRAVQQSEIVQVLLLAEVNRERCCLIEVDEFDLVSGLQRSLRRPPVRHVCNGETWREATQAALEELVGIDRTLQRQFLQIDEESYNFHEEKGRSVVCPGLLTETKVHEISVRCLQEGLRTPDRSRSKQELDDGEELVAPLDIVGLPSGRDFVTRQDTKDGRISVRVWCWKNRQYQKSFRFLEFCRYLERYGVDLSCYAKNENKSLFQFFVEVNEDKASYLQEAVATSSGGQKRLQRVVDLLQVKVIADVLNRKRFLVTTEQMLDDGSVRQVDELVCHTLTPSEDSGQAMRKVIKNKLGLDEEVQARCLRSSGGGEGDVYREEVQNSKGYPGIESVYRIRTITQIIVDPQDPDLARIGLPRANDFVTREGEMGVQQGGQINVWTWRPLMEDTEDGPQLFTGTALEELNRALHDAEEMILRTSLDPQIVDHGLTGNLATVLQKIKFCTERSANIDATLSHVDVKSMMQKSLGAKKASKVGGIADFIAANFTRARTGSVVVENHADRRLSRVAEFAPQSSLERWGSAMPVVEHIRSNQDVAELDIFDLQERSTMRVIQTYGEYALVPLCRMTMNCEPETSRKFLEQVSSLYFNNQYHNAAHAVQVTHSGLWLTRKLGLEDVQNELEHAAFIISALCHDVKHFGRTNAFVINSEHSLALLYNNAKVLENMHASTTFELLQASGNDNTSVLSNVTREDRVDLRLQIIEHILATDMSEHFEAISKFRVRMESHDFSIESEADRRFVARMIMKSGDIGHSSLPWLLHLKWSQLVIAEFLEQGDEESQLGLTVSALCDRTKMGDVGKSQKGFLEFVCLPLLEVLDMSYSKIRLKEEPCDPWEDIDVGARVVVTKNARTKGMTGSILNPDYNGLIQVEMDVEDEKGQIKSYKKADLRIIKEDEGGEWPVRSTWIKALQKNTNLWIEDKVAVARIQRELNISPLERHCEHISPKE